MAHLTLVDTHVLDDANQAASREKSMTLLEGLRLYPQAVAWSVAISACVIMEGFDLVLIGGLYGQPAFSKRFGEKLPDGTYQVSAPWQTGLNNAALVGEILGLMVVGSVAERIGYRKTLMIALTMIIGFIFILFFVQSLPMLLVGELLCGIPWGAFVSAHPDRVCVASF
jgi:SP family general alpha glucoside:H+ symporter-like MFS transporter